MRLKTFKVTNFRSIHDSGEVQVSQVTALLGRNESGKSNLLRALAALNPPGEFKPLDPVKNFPKNRRLSECKDSTPVVWSAWELDDADRASLSAILPRASSATGVHIGRNYGKTRWVSLQGLAAPGFDDAEVRGKVKKIVPAVRAAADAVAPEKKAALEAAADAAEQALGPKADGVAWAKAADPGIAALRKALAAADADLSEKQDQVLSELEDLARTLAGDEAAQAKAGSWVVDNMPVFVFLEEYPELRGHQNIKDYLARLDKKVGADEDDRIADESFSKLCKVADLDPKQLQELYGQDESETRNQLVNRASAVVTGEIKRLWKDRSLKVRFNLDAEHLDTYISDPNTTYDVEVNLSERSRGFQWFFSFYVAFAADTKGGDADGAILLLDEPGLYLHARSQSDLLGHFEKDFKNQIVYTTHSPFMVPTQRLDSIRTVNISEERGTTVSNDPTGDSRTLFPLQAALGYDIAQSLFVGPNNLVLEGVTDYWALAAVSAHLGELGRRCLREDLTLTPAGGAQKVSYMVALLTSERLNVLVLLDHETQAAATKTELVRLKLLSEDNVVMLSEAFGNSSPTEADVEDLLDPATYAALVAESYAKELSDKTLPLNAQLPRIARRYERAFESVGLKFHKTRPMRLFLQKLSTAPSSVLDSSTLDRFETLFTVINTRLEKHLAKPDARPFTR